jgi:hypothetical protein
MISRSNLLVIGFIAFLFGGCFDDVTEPPFITDAQWELILTVARENNFPESTPRDSFVAYIYDEWPNEYRIKDFFVIFPVQDKNKPRKLVLSDVLTKIGKVLRIHYEDPRTGSVYPAYIDSVEIRTDSVIIIPCLDLEDCNLTHLPPQIGKIRTRVLDISWNKGLILPIEITQMDSFPQPYKTLRLNFDQTWTQAELDSMPDWENKWIGFHNISYSKK